MAASMEKCARIQLLFKQSKIEPSWLFVKTNKLPCIADIENLIRNKFDLLSSDIKLYLSGCILPSWESSELLHDNDVVDVVIVEKNGIPGVCSSGEQVVDANNKTEILKNRKKKKHRSNHIGDLKEENDGIEFTENVADADDNTENPRKSKKSKHRTKNDINDKTESTGSITNSSKCNNQPSNKMCGVENAQDVLSVKLHKHKKRKSEIMEVMDSIIHDQNNSQFVKVIPDMSTDAVTIVSSKCLKPVTNSLHSDDLDKSQFSSVNTDLNTSQVSVENIVSNTEGSEVKKKRVRVRNRKKKAASLQESSNAPSKENSAEVEKSNIEWPVVKNVKLNLPRSKRPKNKRFTFEDSDGSNGEEDTSGTWKTGAIVGCQEVRDFPSTDSHIPGCGISHMTESYNRAEFSYDSVTPVNTYSRRNHVQSVDSSLTNRVKVYTRQTFNRNSGQFGERSKEDQLSTVLTNHSVILKNPGVEETNGDVFQDADGAMGEEADVDSYQDVDAVTGEENNTAVYEGTGEREMEETGETEVVKDYTGFPALHGAPRIGDKIAFKVLELSDTYEPGLSSFKEAEVLNYEPNTTMVSLKILNKSNITKRCGKFDIVDEEDENVSENEVMHPWPSLVETKLL